MKIRPNGGFTLIELLVAIAITAILASLSIPALQNMQRRSKQVAQVNNVKQIILGLKLFAGENNGLYPQVGDAIIATKSDGTSKEGLISNISTTAFDALIPKYISSENIFFNSARTDKIEPNENQELANEENVYSYVYGLNSRSKGTAPLVLEEVTSQGLSIPSHPWLHDRKIIVGFNDGSVVTHFLIANQPGGTIMQSQTSAMDNILADSTGEEGGGLLPIGDTVEIGGTGTEPVFTPGVCPCQQ